MSGVTCQFCGKPLWRIRRGSDGDFCSREHRNQYKLRMGLSHLAEAEKVTLVRRKCENPNVQALNRPWGMPETQKRRSAACGILTDTDPVARLAHPSGIGSAALGESPAPLRIEAARRALVLPRGEWARPYRSRPKLAKPGQIRLGGRSGQMAAQAVKPPRVPLADGALRHPVFLIARFPYRAPVIPKGPTSKGTPAAGGPSARTGLCRARSVESTARSTRTPFSPSPKIRQTDIADDLADLSCVPYTMVSYQPADSPAEPRRIEQEQFVREVARPAAALNPMLRPAAAARATARPMVRELEPWSLDLSRSRKSAGPLMAAHSQPVFREAPAGERQAGVVATPTSIQIPPREAVEHEQRPAALPCRPRTIGRGRRANWSGRTRLPGLTPRTVEGHPAKTVRDSRVATVPYSQRLLQGLAPHITVHGEVAGGDAGCDVAAGVRGPSERRTTCLPPPPKDLVVAPRRVNLLGSLEDRLPEAQSQVLEENFSNGLAHWSGETSGWKLNIAGVRPAGAALFAPSMELADYTLEFLARVERGSLTCLFRAQSVETAQVLRIVSGGSGLERYTLTDGAMDSRASAALTGIPSGKALNVRLEARGGEFSLAVNGRQIDHWNDTRLLSGGVGFSSNPEDRVRLYWVKLTHSQPANHPPGCRQP